MRHRPCFFSKRNRKQSRSIVHPYLQRKIVFRGNHYPRFKHPTNPGWSQNNVCFVIAIQNRLLRINVQNKSYVFCVFKQYREVNKSVKQDTLSPHIHSIEFSVRHSKIKSGCSSVHCFHRQNQRTQNKIVWINYFILKLHISILT